MNIQQLSERIDHIEKLLVDRHPNKEAHLDSLRIQHGSPEEKAAQAKKAEIEAAAKANGQGTVVVQGAPSELLAAIQELQAQVEEQNKKISEMSGDAPQDRQVV